MGIHGYNTGSILDTVAMEPVYIDILYQLELIPIYTLVTTVLVQVSVDIPYTGNHSLEDSLSRYTYIHL